MTPNKPLPLKSNNVIIALKSNRMTNALAIITRVHIFEIFRQVHTSLFYKDDFGLSNLE